MKANKKIIITVCATVAVASSVLAFHYSHTTSDLASKTPEQLRQYFDSNEFRNLDERTRRERFGNIMREAMTKRVNEYCALPAEKQIAYLDKIIDNMESRRNRPLFAAMSPDGNRPPGPPDGNQPPPGDMQPDGGLPFFGGMRPDGNRPPGAMSPDGNRPDRRQRGQFRRRPNAANMRARSEQISAQTRLQMAIFRRDMRKRMEERGISFPRPPGGGGQGPQGGGPPEGGPP